MRAKSAVRSTRSKTMSAVERIAHALRTTALDADEGAYLGSEDGLSAQFEVSAPTLRQAARLLEHEGVLKVKRGVRDGYYADRPKMEAITRVGATWLRVTPNAQRDIASVMDVLTPLIVRSVIASDRLQELEEVVRTYPPDHVPENYAEYESRFITLLMSLTDNSVVQLIHAIFYQLGVTIPRQTRDKPTKELEVMWFATIDLAKSLLARDEAASIEHFRTRRRPIQTGIQSDIEALKQK